MQIYLDESGGLGTRDRFFVIAALIPDKPKRIKNIVKHACVQYSDSGICLPEIKGSKLSFPHRQELLNKIIQKPDIRFAYVVADKNHLSSHLLSRQNICFNYLASFLLKPFIENGNELVELFVDNRNSKVASGNSLREHIQIQAYTKWNFSGDLTLRYMDSKTSKIIQAVDVVANTVYQHYERNLSTAYRSISAHVQHKVQFPFEKFGKN